MTGSRVVRLPFDKAAVKAWSATDKRHTNWPVVYVLDAAGKRRATDLSLGDVYVGESVNAAGRMLQHLDSPTKQHLESIRVVIDERFTKSACLDLESYLIRLLAGDGTYRVLNRNEGITDADYFDRAAYRKSFDEVFEQLRQQGMFSRSIPEIENSNLFKLSPFKALQPDQAVAVEDILEGLVEDLAGGERSTIVIQGEPGTGKTVVAIYLMKLLADIADTRPDDEPDADSLFAEFFTEGYREHLRSLRVGLVVPQQSLRKSIQGVFRRTPGLHPDSVLTPFQVGEHDEHFDLLIVDEAHRLNQRANQASGVLNKKFANITKHLFGRDDPNKTQLDWIRQETHTGQGFDSLCRPPKFRVCYSMPTLPPSTSDEIQPPRSSAPRRHSAICGSHEQTSRSSSGPGAAASAGPHGCVVSVRSGHRSG